MSDYQLRIAQALTEHGELTKKQIAEITGLDYKQISNAMHHMRDNERVEPVGESRNIDCLWRVTDVGREYAASPGTQKRRPYKKRAKPPAQTPAPAPTLPNLSTSAHTLADNISALLHENSELRNALTDIRTRINKLLGDDKEILENVTDS